MTRPLTYLCPPPNDELLEDVPPDMRASFRLAMGAWIESGLHGLWLDRDAGDGHSVEALAKGVGLRYSELADLWNIGGMQSPIEHRLAGALLWVDVDWAGKPSADYRGGPEDPMHADATVGAVEFWITPQAPIAGCRVDFLLWFKRGRTVGGVAIECDGHEFHEKTKEQAARDKDRDRRILLSGFPVMRFTGSEIYRDALACAEQVRDALRAILGQVSREGLSR